MNVELARSAASRRPGEAQRLKEIPPDAEYQGKGPLYVWTGEKWLDIHTWMAMNADPRQLDGEVTVTEAPRKPVRRAESETGWLFEETEEG